jgi:hypothetical protein
LENLTVVATIAVTDLDRAKRTRPATFCSCFRASRSRPERGAPERFHGTITVDPLRLHGYSTGVDQSSARPDGRSFRVLLRSRRIQEARRLR